MSNPTATGAFIILTAAGILLVGAEVFLPGGVVGSLGGLMLLAAAVTAFIAFGTTWGMLVLLLLVVLTFLGVWAWMRWFPRTRMGRSLSLQADEKAMHAAESPVELLDTVGVAESDLRPAGIARLNNRRTDVVAEADFIPAGATIRVIEVRGSRVVVRAENPEQEPS